MRAVDRSSGAFGWQVEAAGTAFYTTATASGNSLYLATSKDLYPTTGPESIGTVYALQLP